MCLSFETYRKTLLLDDNMLQGELSLWWGRWDNPVTMVIWCPVTAQLVSFRVQQQGVSLKGNNDLQKRAWPSPKPLGATTWLLYWYLPLALFSILIFSFDILNTLDLMSHKGQVAELLELWFTPDRKLSSDLCPTQSEQFLGSVNVSEKHINGNVSPIPEEGHEIFCAFFFFPPWERVEG